MACARMDRHEGTRCFPDRSLAASRTHEEDRRSSGGRCLASGSRRPASWARRNDRGRQGAFFSSSARRARSTARCLVARKLQRRIQS